MLISDKADFKRMAIKRDKEAQFIIFKGIIHQEDIILINVYAPQIGALKYIRKIGDSQDGGDIGGSRVHFPQHMGETPSRSTEE